MKKWQIWLILAVLMASCSLSIYAKHDRFYDRPGKAYKAPGHYREREDAGYIIHRSASVIFAAQRAAQHGHNYYGLGRAVAHQQKSRELYWAGAYRGSIYHSLRARDLAFQVIELNRERPRREYYRDEMEDRYSRSAPGNRELDIRADTVKVGNNDALVRLHFGLDINQ